MYFRFKCQNEALSTREEEEEEEEKEEEEEEEKKKEEKREEFQHASSCTALPWA